LTFSGKSLISARTGLARSRELPELALLASSDDDDRLSDMAWYDEQGTPESKQAHRLKDMINMDVKVQ
jgi:hypothetical protein